MLLGNYGGYQVIVSDAEKYKTVSRPWKERLFTWPWKPLLKAKSIPDGYFIKNGKVIKYGDQIIVNPVTYKQLEEQFGAPHSSKAIWRPC